MNYTKGKLRVSWLHNNLFVRDEDNRILAEMHDGSYEEKEANAELFAAAPAMYEALKQWMKYLDTNYPQNMMQKKHAYNLTEQALAKAEGK
jgi:hypothetical protein